MAPRRVNFTADGTPGAYPDTHDDAYVHPAVVGRLTAAVVTYALNGRRLGGRSRFSLRSCQRVGRPGTAASTGQWRKR